jgi:hypothetical protein
MLYYVTQSGLNTALWAPAFTFLQLKIMFGGILNHCWMGDLDIGKIFLKFSLHPHTQKLCGVDLKEVGPNGS